MHPLTSIAVYLLCTAPVAFAGEFRVGAAAVPVTPDPGTPMAGYYSTRLAEGVEDDLFARAIVVEQDGAKAAMVVCDLISMPRAVAEDARRLIEKSTGLPPERVMISATHTHTGPTLPTGSSRDPSEEGAAEAARRYVRTLPNLIARSVSAANAALRPARVSVGFGREERLSFNRRYFMTDGTVGWNPGKQNPQVVKPAGPIDPEVPVVYFETTDGRPIATYVNFAMHLDTVGGLKVSADYPFTLGAILAKLKGPDMVTLFSIGCAGDINHIDVSSADRQQGPREAARIGTVLAGEVVKTYARLTPLGTAPPRPRREVLALPLAPIKPDEVEPAMRTAVKFGKDAPTFLERVNAYKVIDVHARQGRPLEAEVQVIALGPDLAFVALPGEIFVELGLFVKQNSPYRHTIIAELANGSVGYVPTRRAFAEGNYEPVSARCAPGSGEQVAVAAVRLLKELRAEAGGN
jgi:neutral ceramidase